MKAEYFESSYDLHDDGAVVDDTELYSDDDFAVNMVEKGCIELVEADPN